MASEFQRRKIAGVFEAMDVDGDGFLQESDFAALTARWTAIRGPGDHPRLTAIMMGWWRTLLAAADHDGDEQVNPDEVLLLADRRGQMPDEVAGTAAPMFEAVDENADGRISS